MTTTCERCGGPLPVKKITGPAARTCSARCRKATSRARQAAAAEAVQAAYTAELTAALPTDQEPHVPAFRDLPADLQAALAGTRDPASPWGLGYGRHADGRAVTAAQVKAWRAEAGMDTTEADLAEIRAEAGLA